MFEKASRLKLRFATQQGNASVEDLWDLPLTKLNVLAKQLNKEIKTSSEEDYLEVQSTEDAILKLKFDLVLHVLTTKKDENEARKNAGVKKAEKERLLAILDSKKNEALEDLSVEELEKKINEL